MLLINFPQGLTKCLTLKWANYSFFFWRFCRKQNLFLGFFLKLKWGETQKIVFLWSKRKVFANFKKILILRFLWFFLSDNIAAHVPRARVRIHRSLWNWTNKIIPDRQHSARFRGSQKRAISLHPTGTSTGGGEKYKLKADANPT